MTTPTPAQADEKVLQEIVRRIREPSPHGCQHFTLTTGEAMDLIRPNLAALRPEGEAVAPVGYVRAADLNTLTERDQALIWGSPFPGSVALFASPPAPAEVKVKSEPAAHSYSPDYQAMGDCRVCGHQPENCTGRSALLPPSPEAQAGSPAEALPSQTSGAEAGGEAQFTAAFLRISAQRRDVPENVRQQMLTAAALLTALAKPALEPAGGGVTNDMVSAAWNKAKTRRMTGTPSDFRAVLEAALSSPAEAEALPDGVDVSFPAYGEMSFSELGRAVKAAQFGTPEPYEFDPEFYPGHQIVGTINFNSLNRIVTWFVKRALSPAPAQAGSFVASASDRPEPNGVEELVAALEARDEQLTAEFSISSELRAALRVCQRALAAMIAPDAIKHTTIVNAFAACAEAEARARKALENSKAGLADAIPNGSAPAGEERRRDDPFRPAVDVDADDDYYPSREED